MKVLTFPQLKSRKGIPFTRVHINRLEKVGAFPKKLRLGSNSVAWSEEEIDAWLESRPRAAAQEHAIGNHG